MDILAKNLYIININNLLNYENLYINISEIKNMDDTNVMRYRYCERFNGLGKDMIDIINIVV